MVSSILFTRMLHVLFSVYSLHELFSSLSCSLFAYVKNNFASGLLFTFLLHQLWICGFHGSHLPEPVASTEFACVSPQTIFSKSFFDTYVVMGGCGTTICILLLLLIFYREDRMGNPAKVGAVSVIFNINEVLNFGLPIVLNPVMAIPFLVTPMVTYCTACAATWLGLVPAVTHEIQWSPPPLLSGYLATGSIRGTILQIVCILMGMAIYYPFLRLHKEVQDTYYKEKLTDIVKELQIKEEPNETPPVFNTLRQSRSDFPNAVTGSEAGDPRRQAIYALSAAGR